MLESEENNQRSFSMETCKAILQHDKAMSHCQGQKENSGILTAHMGMCGSHALHFSSWFNSIKGHRAKWTSQLPPFLLLCLSPGTLWCKSISQLQRKHLNVPGYVGFFWQDFKKVLFVCLYGWLVLDPLPPNLGLWSTKECVLYLELMNSRYLGFGNPQGTLHRCG